MATSNLWWLCASAALTLAAVSGGCDGATGEDGFGPGDGIYGEGGPGGDADLLGGNPDGSAAAQSLVITPANPVLDLPLGGGAAAQQFEARAPGSQTVLSANWSIDNVAIGTIDATGRFTTATAGGQATITAQSGKLSGTTTVTVKAHLTENPGAVDAATQAKLKAGGPVDPAMTFLYPYDKTVFPRGLLPPTVQLAGPDATFFYLHVSGKYIDYQGFFAGSSPSRIALTPATWHSLTASAGPNDPLKVEVTKITGGTVAGPVAETWTIAQGNLKGTVYYNTYNSPMNNSSGAVMRIKPGANADILAGGCSVCHAVSANGNVLVTLGGPSVTTEQAYAVGAKFDLTAGTSAARGDSLYGFAGVYPDGSYMLTNGAVGGSWPPNVPGVGDIGGGDRASQLVDLGTGSAVSASGIAGHMMMPSFSVDGKKVAFNHYDVGGGHSLAVMDFTLATKAFSGLVDIVTETKFPGWPAFLPDAKSFAYHVTDGQDFATWQGHTSNLYVVDLATKTKTLLAAANGMNGATPYIAASDVHLNYEPTSLPLAVGGYYWVVFTSRRQFGNMIAGGDPWGTASRKKLWVTAIDMNPAPGADPSHPAFYLEGQEFGAGNMRGFWALDPCKQNGNDCTSGDECCNGFCRQVNVDGSQQLVCVPPPSGCANEFEKCTTDADCCNAATGTTCIAGHCATPITK